MVDSSPSPAVSVPQALGRLRVALDDAYLRAARSVGLTPQQAELLCAAMNPASVGKLAAALRCDRSNVTRLVDRAATHGYVSRQGDSADGRVSVVALSPQGQEVALEFLRKLESQTAGLLGSWPASRQQTATAILTEIADALDSPPANPGP